MQEKIIIGKELLVTQMNHWFLFPIAATAAGLINNGKPDMRIWLLLSALPFLLFLVRRYTNKGLALLFTHAALAVLVLCIPEERLLVKALYLFYAVGCIVYSFYLRIITDNRLDQNVNPIFAVALSAIMLLFQQFQGNRDRDLYYVLPLIISLGLYLIHYYVEHYLHFLVVNESNAGCIPQKEIFRSGIKLAALYAGAGMVILLMTSNTAWLAYLLKQIKNGLVWLLSLIPWGEGQGEQVYEIYEEPAGDMGWLPPQEMGDPLWLWVLLERILLTVLAVAAAAAFVLALARLVRFLLSRMRENISLEQSRLDSVGDVRERCGIEREHTRHRAFFSFPTPAERIRRLYKKRILAEKQAILQDGETKRLETLTARECGLRIDADVLVQLYEKARYSAEECTKEDVKRIP